MINCFYFPVACFDEFTVFKQRPEQLNENSPRHQVWKKSQIDWVIKNLGKINKNTDTFFNLFEAKTQRAFKYYSDEARKNIFSTTALKKHSLSVQTIMSLFDRIIVKAEYLLKKPLIIFPEDVKDFINFCPPKLLKITMGLFKEKFEKKHNKWWDVSFDKTQVILTLYAKEAYLTSKTKRKKCEDLSESEEIEAKQLKFTNEFAILRQEEQKSSFIAPNIPILEDKGTESPPLFSSDVFQEFDHRHVLFPRISYGLTFNNKT